MKSASGSLVGDFWFMNWIHKCSQTDECATIENCKISRLMFADDLVLLFSPESGPQRALNSFADACDPAGIKISTAKSEVLRLSRNPERCELQVKGATLKQVEKFKYFWVAFTSDGRQDEERDTLIGKASAVMRALHYSVVMNREFVKRGKALSFQNNFCPSSYQWILGNDRKNAIIRESVRNEVFTKNSRSYII